MATRGNVIAPEALAELSQMNICENRRSRSFCFPKEAAGTAA